MAEHTPEHCLKLDGLSEQTIRALRLSVGHINTFSRNPISLDEFWAELTAFKPGDTASPHFWAVFEETDIETIHDLILGRDIDAQHLAVIGNALLPIDHPTRIWLNEQI